MADITPPKRGRGRPKKYENLTDRIKEYNKEYYELNKLNSSECAVCGKMINPYQKRAHEMTKQHMIKLDDFDMNKWKDSDKLRFVTNKIINMFEKKNIADNFESIIKEIDGMEQ